MATTMISKQSLGALQHCKLCQHEFRAPLKLVGRQIPCPHCRRMMEVEKPATGSEDRLVGREIGGCLLKKRLGSGALGVVYEAEQTATGRSVAVKMLSSKAMADAEVVARFQREARLCAQVRHQHVVEVYDCGFERGVHYLVMEYVEGSTFASLIEEYGRLPWRDALIYVMQVAHALKHLHAQSIIHRDIKPANVLIDYQGSAKLADLGLAKRLENDGTGGAALTMQGVAMGSPAYMPPEQIRDAKAATPQSDLYALGASFYQAVSGTLPFDGKSASEVMSKVLKDEPAPLKVLVPDLPETVISVIMRLLSKDPALRIQSAAALAEELDAILRQPDRPAPLPEVRRPEQAATTNQSPRPRPGPLPIIVAGLAVAVIAAIVAAILLTRP